MSKKQYPVYRIADRAPELPPEDSKLALWVYDRTEIDGHHWHIASTPRDYLLRDTHWTWAETRPTVAPEEQAVQPSHIIIRNAPPHSWYETRVAETFAVVRFERLRDPSQGIPGDVYWVRTGDAYNSLNFVRASDAASVLVLKPSDTRVCHAPGDKCLGCPHYHGKADVCEYAGSTDTPVTDAGVFIAYEHMGDGYSDEEPSYRGEAVDASIARKLERDLATKRTIIAELVAALGWSLHQLQGDSGTGETYWETVPGYAEAKAALARAKGGAK